MVSVRDFEAAEAGIPNIPSLQYTWAVALNRPIRMTPNSSARGDHGKPTAHMLCIFPFQCLLSGLTWLFFTSLSYVVCKSVCVYSVLIQTPDKNDLKKVRH